MAEAYRKAGLIDEAIEIAREGMRVHPGFIGGRVALARALFDKQRFEEVISELAGVLRDAPDNLVAQRLVAESCLMLGRVAEALGAYKMLLYYSPADTELSRLVQELEAQAYQKGALVLRSDPAPEARPAAPPADFGIAEAKGAIDQDPALKRAAWMKRIEVLQDLLQRVQRYRSEVSRDR